MHEFSLWAPRIGSLRVRVDGIVHPMHVAGRGWWKAVVADAESDMDYEFLIDDDPRPYPDPRSLWQPYGVHSASRILDRSRFDWNDEAWVPLPLSKAVVYELHIGTFTPEGTFTAAAENLGELRALGITHIEVMPVNSFPGRWGWGYDGVALFAPQEVYGGPDGLKHFVNACHASGLAVLLDVVYNHFGPVGNYTGLFGPYITQNHQTPWGGAVNLEEAGSYEVRRFFCDNALMWLRDYHFDGLRLDAVHAYVDRSATHFLEQLATEVEDLSNKLGRKCVLIAESDLNDPRMVTPLANGTKSGSCSICGLGMDAQWSDDFHHALFAILTGERRTYYSDFGSLAQLAKSLTSVFVYDGEYSEYRGRLHGRPVKNLSAHRFFVYIQNHDQVGNRAHGERLPTDAGIQRSRLAAALVLTAPFIPMIFQGEEYAASTPFLYFADHEDPEIAHSVSEGRRREHASEGEWNSIPDPESQETFDRSKLIWSEREEGEHKAMLDWYRALIQMRQSEHSLLDGELGNTHVCFNEDAQWLTMRRGSLQLIFNFSINALRLPIQAGAKLVLSSEPGVQFALSEVILPPISFAAVSVDAESEADEIQ